jgi:hypothetical protein
VHIHANMMNPQAAGLYDPSSLRAAQAERAAQTRRKLLSAAQTMGATDLESLDPDAGLLIGRWLNANHNQSLADDSYAPGPTHVEPFPG